MEIVILLLLAIIITVIAAILDRREKTSKRSSPSEVPEPPNDLETTSRSDIRTIEHSVEEDNRIEDVESTPEPSVLSEPPNGPDPSVATPSGPNPQQQAAIRIIEGPLLIIAGPGSGKTFTLIERIYHLISEHGIPPEQLFVSTFTEKAAAELLNRVSSKLAADDITVNLNEMYIGTFHSICLRFLKEHREYTRLKRNFTVLDQFDQQYFLYQRLHDYQEIEGSEYILGGWEGSWWRKAKDLVNWVNKVSEEALDPEVLLNATEPEVQALGRCYQQYQKHLQAENSLDFSTIQIEALRLLEGHPEILDDIREKIQYLMVDEYQDTNTVQERILFKLAEPDFNLCVVGDDDQGLYRFRGATVRNILEFPENDFSGKVCQRVTLTTNYRSSPGIIAFYNEWMRRFNWIAAGKTFRYEKEIVPNAEKELVKTPTVLKVSGALTAEDWHAEVLAFLYRLRDSGALTDWNQVAFLFSSVRRKEVVALSDALEAAGIPVYSPRSDQFFERAEIRLMIGALISLFPQFPEVRQWSEGAQLDIWAYYDNECLAEFTDELRRPENQSLLAWCQSHARVPRTLTERTGYTFSELFSKLLQFPLFSRYLGNVERGDVIDSRPARNLAIFSQLLDKYEDLYHVTDLTPNNVEEHLRRLFNQFFRILKDGGINEYEDASEYAPNGCVSFMTIHQSKGLEFPVVIVGSMNATPWKPPSGDLDALLQQKYYSKEPFEPLDQTHNYDFRRLFYTAFSRAQNFLILTCQEQRGWRRAPSEYFEPVYTPLPSWRSTTFHPEYLTLEAIKDVDMKHTYSFTSHITVFENCARQYKFYRYLDFVPRRLHGMLFGMLVHQTIEDIHRVVLRGEADGVTEAQIKNWFAVNYAQLSQQERVYLNPGQQDEALDCVLRYACRERGTWDRLLETEVEVSLAKEAYLLKGYVDLIRRGEGDTLEIIDFKSGKKPDLVSEQEKVEQHKRQLEVYAHMIEECTGHEISKMYLYYTGEGNDNSYVSFDKDAYSINRTMEEFDNIVSRIENKDFEIDTRPKELCRDCAMKAYCDTM